MSTNAGGDPGVPLIGTAVISCPRCSYTNTLYDRSSRRPIPMREIPEGEKILCKRCRQWFVVVADGMKAIDPPEFK